MSQAIPMAKAGSQGLAPMEKGRERARERAEVAASGRAMAAIAETLREVVAGVRHRLWLR